MRRTNRMVLGLVAVFVLGSSLALLGCGGGDDNLVDINAANASFLIGGRAFTFPVDTGFGVTNGVLAFNNTNPVSRFAISAGNSRATGTITFGSCIFTVGPNNSPDGVGGGSNFALPGPQPKQVFVVDSCQFDNDTNALVLNGVSSTITQDTGTGGFGG